MAYQKDIALKRSEMSCDIAGRNRLAEALRVSEVRYRRLFETAKDGILILDAETGIILDANPFLIELLNSSVEMFLGKEVWELGFFKDIVANKAKFAELQQKGYVRYDNLPLETDDGRKIDVEFVSNVYFEGDVCVIQCNIRDIAERRKVERNQALSYEILGILDTTLALPELLNAVLTAIKKTSGFDAVGIRLETVNDFPYFVQNGFSNDFLLTENTLIAQDRDGVVCRDANGSIMLECNCGLVISGKTDPANPLFTPYGSFWTNNSFPLLNLPADQDPRFRPRNKCMYAGYGSIALIPIRANQKTIGLLQLNNRKKDSLTIDMICVFEKISATIGVVLMQKQSEVELRKSEARLQTLIQTIPDLIWLKDADGAYLSCNAMFERYFGAKEADIVGKTDYEFVERELADYFREHDRKAMAAGKPTSNEEWITFADDGRRAFMDTIKTPMYGPKGTLIGVLGIGRDITKRKQEEEKKENLELQLRESHKMEAVGQLAGGISHDFNNLLSVINGYSQVLLMDPDLKDNVRAKLEEILRTGERAAGLTRQLLVFSRHQQVEFKILDLDIIISGMEKMLLRLIRENIIVTRNIGPELWLIKADPGNIEQVIMNLIINASDAMPDGGTLTVETENMKIDKSNRLCHHADIVPGSYVMLSVSDTGCGMDDKVREHIFEPFFTTKEVGKGTGLGLATVYGIVKQSNAHIDVQSELGKGTMFRIYFPRIATGDATHKGRQETAIIPLGTETILLAEDQDGVRGMLQIFLQSIGYTVLPACNGKEALELAKNYAGQIHVLLTDIVMPGMNGFDLSKDMKILLPEIKLLFMSGYNEPTDSNKTITISDNFIQKPIQLDVMSVKLRKILE